MKFEWDSKKNIINIEKHGIDFNDAKELFEYEMLTIEDTREAYGESRWIAIGRLKAFVSVIIYVEQEPDLIRIISARKATKREVRQYEESLKNRLG